MPETPEPPRPTDGELEILTVLWARGPSTVREVHDAIAQRKPALYTTVLKLLQIMMEKSLVRRDVRQRAHVYEASRPREWTQRQLAGTCCGAPSEVRLRACCWGRFRPARRRPRSWRRSAA